MELETGTLGKRNRWHRGCVGGRDGSGAVYAALRVEGYGVGDHGPIGIEGGGLGLVPRARAGAVGVVVLRAAAVGRGIVGAKLVARADGRGDGGHRRVIGGVCGSSAASAKLPIKGDDLLRCLPLGVESGARGDVPIGCARAVGVVVRNALRIGVGAELVAGAGGRGD